MLKIESVEIHGFKSFCDPTEVRFPGGITAVVGPNGCGKSNIGDAIHWVLGEQSPRTLRGGKMEDVIFAGTESRGPHGMAEVSLKLTSANGDLAGGDGAAIVTRRLFRSGDSEYLLNGRKVRLRDIQEMLHGAKVGATTYAVIEQGKVDAMLSAKPRERRFLIEEAAGIIGYKQKRRLAELKLEATEANLLRVHDVVVEVHRQINSLKRQAARARRYSRVRDEQRAVDARLLAARARAFEVESLAVGAALAEVQAREAEAGAALGRAEAEIESLRVARRELEQEASALRESVHALGREIDREDASIKAETDRAVRSRAEAERLAGETQELSGRLEDLAAQRGARAALLESIGREVASFDAATESLAGEEREIRKLAEAVATRIESRRSEQFAGSGRLAEISNTLVHLRKEGERIEAQAARLAAERRDAEREAADLDVRVRASRSAESEALTVLASAQEQGSRARERRQTLERLNRDIGEMIAGRRETLARLEERVRSLQDDEKALAGIDSGARWLLTQDGGARVKGVVADFVRTAPESEDALEGYLGPLLGAVVVPTSDAALSLVGELAKARAGRCLFVLEDETARPWARTPVPPVLASEPGVLGSLADRVATSNGIGGLLARRLVRAIVVRDLATAIDLARRVPGHDYVTLAGEVVTRDGTIQGGGSSEDGPLARRRLLESARAELDGASVALAGGDEERRSSDSALAEAGDGLEAVERSLREAEKSAALSQERTRTLAAESDRAARRVGVLSDEIARLAEERDENRSRLDLEEQEKLRLEQSLASLVEALETEKAELDAFLVDLAARAERLTETRTERAAARERLNHAAEEHARLASEVAGVGERVDHAVTGRNEADRISEEADVAAGEARERLARRLAEHAEAQTGLDALDEKLRACVSSCDALESEARGRRSRLDALREERRAAEVAAASADSELRHLEEKCRETLDEDLSALLGRVSEEPDVDLAALEVESAALRSRLEAIGPVNLLAIEEFRELETRLQFLQTQEKDLTDSIESLKETIRRINRTSRELFVEAFDRIRANFNDTFKLLFGGGRAEIRLMEDEDPLECGLEIIVQPPGKRLQSLSLLSGGERALSAIALLFAIFRYQPSPFCLLDEVDAALDESNVRRFTRLLQEFSEETQFIVITHNKRSMEAANTLYGVTMEEPGISRILSMSLS